MRLQTPWLLSYPYIKTGRRRMLSFARFFFCQKPDTINPCQKDCCRTSHNDQLHSDCRPDSCNKLDITAAKASRNKKQKGMPSGHLPQTSLVSSPARKPKNPPVPAVLPPEESLHSICPESYASASQKWKSRQR